MTESGADRLEPAAEDAAGPREPAELPGRPSAPDTARDEDVSTRPNPKPSEGATDSSDRHSNEASQVHGTILL